MTKWFEFAHSLADASGEIILRHFRTPIKVEDKKDNTPVTQVDRETEKKLRQLIVLRFPEHGVMGEEFDLINPKSSWQWVLDSMEAS